VISFPQVSSPKPCIRLSFPHTCYIPRPSLLDLITRTILDGDKRSLNLRSSFSVSDQISHPYTTTGKIIVLYILFFKFLESELEDERFCIEW
jgi:hypothetical protein